MASLIASGEGAELRFIMDWEATNFDASYDGEGGFGGDETVTRLLCSWCSIARATREMKTKWWLT